MGLRDKVALVYAVTFILYISYVACMPKTKKTIKVLNKCARSQNGESIYKKYKFPETEYSTSFKSSPTYNFDDFDTYTLNKPSQRSQNLLKQTRNKRKRKLLNNNRRKVENAIDISPCPSVPKCGDLPHFPEVEYPLNARDIWRPIYWNDLFPPVDNGQSQTKPATKKCQKILKNKNEFDIKNCFKSKSPKSKVQNNTDDGICRKDMNAFMMTTSAPFSNNLLMRDKDSFPTMAEKEKIEPPTATKPISGNMCVITDQSDYQEINKSIPINNLGNTISLPDVCSDDRKNIFQLTDNFEFKNDESDIGVDEEFTTDEPDFAFALSTPPPNTNDMLWKESKVIEPYNSLLYPDELDDYFIAVKN